MNSIQKIEAQKRKSIKRILNNSDVFQIEDLEEKDPNELEEILNKTLIRFRIQFNFKRRHNKHFSNN